MGRYEVVTEKPFLIPDLELSAVSPCFASIGTDNSEKDKSNKQDVILITKKLLEPIIASAIISVIIRPAGL